MTPEPPRRLTLRDMAGPETVVWALVLLVPVTAAGWGVLTLLDPPGLADDARLALAPAAGAAALSAAFAVGIPLFSPRPALAIATLCVLAPAPIALLRWRPRLVPSQLLVVAIAIVAVVSASVPALAHNSGAAATWGNADPYLWVSQAKSLLDGPPPGPSTLFPDRVAYEHVSRGGWAPALPAFDALASVSTGRDPVDAFGIVVAALFVLTPLASFAIARTALGWTPRLSAAAAVAVALSPSQLFAAYYGWLPQIAGAACALAAALAFRLALGEERAPWRLTLLAALFVAGALGIYRLPFLPYVVAILGVAPAGFLLRHRASLRSAAASASRQTALLAVGCLVLVLPSAVAFAAHASTFWSVQTDVPSWHHYVRALPSDALGLTPRVPDLARAVFLGWRLAGLAVAGLLLVAGSTALWRSRARCPDLVLGIAAASVVAVAVTQLPTFTPYFSIKLMGYAAAPLILVALAPLDRHRPSSLAFAAPALLVASSLAVVLVAGFRTKTAEAFAPLSADAARISNGSSVEIGSRSTWDQMWTIYFVRDHPASVPHASDFLTGLGSSRAARDYRHGCADYAVSHVPLGLRRSRCGIS